MQEVWLSKTAHLMAGSMREGGPRACSLLQGDLETSSQALHRDPITSHNTAWAPDCHSMGLQRGHLGSRLWLSPGHSMALWCRKSPGDRLHRWCCRPRTARLWCSIGLICTSASSWAEAKASAIPHCDSAVQQNPGAQGSEKPQQVSGSRGPGKHLSTCCSPLPGPAVAQGMQAADSTKKHSQVERGVTEVALQAEVSLN